MKKDALKLFDSTKFNVTVTVINIVLIVALVGYLVFLNLRYSANNQSENAESQGAVEVDKIVEDADATMTGIYATLLQGSDFELMGNIEFHFGYNSEFSGYFDVDNKSVEAYTYNVFMDEDNNFWLRIENDDKSKYVEYLMEFDQNGNIILTYPSTNQKFVLEY
jgi:hypothetical protein